MGCGSMESMGKGYFRYGNYDTRPCLNIKGKDGQAFKGYDNIIIELRQKIAQGKRIIVCDLYPGRTRIRSAGIWKRCGRHCWLTRRNV